MYLAIDDTDSSKGMCTTFLLTEIIERSGLDVIGMPALVRLNPTIPFKTRGNGALRVNLGHGEGQVRRIGVSGNHIIRAFQHGSEAITEHDLIDMAEQVVREFAELQEENTNPGIVVSRMELPEEFYWRAVRDVLTVQDAEDFLRKNGAEYVRIKNGRGIIGSAAALSWKGTRRTYELLAYRYPHPGQIPQDMKMSMASEADRIPGTFNNVDRNNRHAAIFPSEKTPVILGIRGRDPEALLGQGMNMVISWNVGQDRILVYESNQGTDDHIIENPEKLEDHHTYRITGRIISFPYSIRGSHYFCQVAWKESAVKIAAFEPTKEFRHTFSQLVPGDLITIYGSYMSGTINVEKLELISRARLYGRINPECTGCHRPMKNHGNGDYRCPTCGERQKVPHYTVINRSLNEGHYDVPVIARRHLSRPFDFAAQTVGGTMA
ncbi:MAG: tRNA(Ile)(2)-agmatinylcytidine synthase [Thermoplasmataceae archaeon]